LDAKTEVIALQYGRLVAEIREPGWNFLSCWGRKITRISTAQISISLHDVKVADYEGNPIVVSAVVLFQVTDPKKAVLDIQDSYSFVRLQASTVLRQVVAQYPYQCANESQSLRGNMANINVQLADTLNGLVLIAGCKINTFRIDELAYAPEVAALMLRKQAAAATVKARKLIVESAVEIAADALDHLRAQGTAMLPEQRADLVINLMTTICAGKDVVPTLAMRTSHSQSHA
jgi:regulator of protease activity HflC (stomatin/prohibitin superfamily)